MEKSKFEFWEDTEIAELEWLQKVCLLFVDEEEGSDERQKDEGAGLKIAETMFGGWMTRWPRRCES